MPDHYMVTLDKDRPWLSSVKEKESEVKWKTLQTTKSDFAEETLQKPKSDSRQKVTVKVK